MELPSVALRSANFRVQGSGQGSVPGQAYLAELPSLAAEITAGMIALKATMMPLADVEQVWSRAEVPGERTVLVPSAAWIRSQHPGRPQTGEKPRR